MEQTSTPQLPAQPPVAPQQATVDPGKILSIVGFVLAFIVSVVGLILSIVALNKSKKAGHKNGLAVAGIIVSSVVTVIWSIFLAIVVSIAISITSTIFEQCGISNTNRVFVQGNYYDCPNSNSSFNNDSTGAEAINVVGTDVTLIGTLVDSECFNFTLPEEYLLSPNAKNCQAELRADNGSATGIALTSITVKYQTGSSTLEDFFSKYKAAGGDKVSNERRMTIDGRESGSVDLVNSLGIAQTVYFIPDDSGTYEYNGVPVTSFHISGPTNLPAPLETIVRSFSIK